MAYTPRRRTGGGNGGSFITRLLGSGDGDTVSENAPIGGAKEPGQVPYQYKGDPSTIVGSKGYVTQKGQLSSQPYADVRSFLGRFSGQENKAEDLNLGLSSQRLAGEMEIRNAARLTFAKDTGLPPELYDTFVAPMAEKARAAIGATTATAKEQEAKSITNKQIEDETRTPRRRIAQQEAQRGVTESTSRTKAASTKEGKQSIEGRYLAEQLAPIFNLRKSATVELQPGEVSQFSSQGLPDQLQKILGPGFTGRGTTYSEQPILGQPIGKSGLRSFLGMGRNVQQGGVFPYSDHNSINEFLGQEQQGPTATPRATGEQFGPMLPSPPKIDLGGVGIPSMQNGILSAPYNPAQPQETPEQAIARKAKEAAQAQELLRRLLQGGTPYTPNTRNF